MSSFDPKAPHRLTGQVFRTDRGETVRLGAKLGGGGEATVHEVEGHPAIVAKVYHAGRPADAEKLAHMLAHAPSDPTRGVGHVSIAWVTGLLYDQLGGLCGFTMPRISGGTPLFMLYNPRERWSRAWAFTWRYLHGAATNLASAVAAVHAAGYVVGDLNESNVLVQSTALLTLVDADSFQVRGAAGQVWRCPVGKPEYTPPEAQGRDFTQFDRDEWHDRFSLGVLLYLMLMEGNHPYKGTGEPPEVEERIRLGYFPFQTPAPSEVGPPRLAPDFSILSPVLQPLFRRCFGRAREARPSAAEWRAALDVASSQLVTCSVNPHHSRVPGAGPCPWCERRTLLRGFDPFPATAPLARSAPPATAPSKAPAAAPASAPVQPPAPAPAPVPVSAPGPVVPATAPAVGVAVPAAPAAASGIAPAPPPPAASATPSVVPASPSAAAAPAAAAAPTPASAPPQAAPAASSSRVRLAVAVLVVLALLAAGFGRWRTQRSGPAPAAVPVETRSVEAPPPESAAPANVVPEPVVRSEPMTFIAIPPGTFQMGSAGGRSDEQPVHTVRISKPFQLLRTEVTQEQWQTVMGANPSEFKACGPACPVDHVSWADAHQFIARLNAQHDGFRYRLPTEAEWEYAAKGGAAGAGAAAPATADAAWFVGNAGGATHPVSQKAPNALGLFDMTGNVAEWVEDWYGAYPRATGTDPAGPGTGKQRVHRGGSALDPADAVTATARGQAGADQRSNALGLRLVREVADVAPPPATPVVAPAPAAPVVDTTPRAVVVEATPLARELGMVFISIPLAPFQMGFAGAEADERPVHEVRLTRAFEIQRTEVTQGQWQTVMQANPSMAASCGPTCPVDNVSWMDAQAFIEKLNALNDGYRYRLPTEAEWEYAARAGVPGDAGASEQPDEFAWWDGNANDRTHPVAQKRPNAWGLFDMYGNVWEWVQDWLGPYPAGSVADPTGPAAGRQRVNRGGSLRAPARRLVPAYRNADPPTQRSPYLGFRLVRER